MKISQAENPHHFHRRLAAFNSTRLTPATPSSRWEEELQEEKSIRIEEGRFLAKLRTEISPLMPREWNSADAFMSWFEALLVSGPGQQHPVFEWLAEEASLENMCWFLAQEVAGEAGFDDLLAYTQVKLPVRAKLEVARNYWDEMGRGKEKAMHGPLLHHMVVELGLQPSINTTVWEALALSNTMIGLALTRRYAYHSIGALGVIELTAPARAQKVAEGMRRLGMNHTIRAYFDLHAVIDVHHSRAWGKEVIRPLLEENPGLAPFIAEGALMRLLCGKKCFDRYSIELQSGLVAA